VGACDTCRGFGRVIGIDEALVVPDGNRSLADGAVKPFQSPSYRECQDDLVRFAGKRGIPLSTPWNTLTKKMRRWVFEGEGSWDDGVWYGVNRFFRWLESRSYKMHVRVFLSRYRAYHRCGSCGGARLKPDALLWRIGPGKGLNIHEIMRLPIDRCHDFFDALRLSPPFDEAAAIVLEEIRTRLRYLVEIGLGYLTLDRQSRTLSGGEVQRINLTTALGTSLVNTLFILDEPSIGLHSRDIGRLAGILRRLRDAGNTLLIVEHDPELIGTADHLIDMGPGPGRNGGNIVFSGSLNSLLRKGTSSTAAFISGKSRIRIPEKRTFSENDSCIEISGASEHNLKDITVRIPLHRITGISGVSGSGKSTLVDEVLYRGICRLKGKPVESPGTCRRITGSEEIADVILVDQSPIGKTTRSNPASYCGVFDPIRKLFAATASAKECGFSAATFSFNSGKGRCPTCEGAGFEQVEMQFLSDVYLSCPECHGKRFKKEVLEIRIGERPGGSGRVVHKSIDGVLAMTVEEAMEYFAAYPRIVSLLTPLMSVGLSYLPLGQPLPTLSGGEAQRLKIAAYLSRGKRARGENILFLFDEPTTGLHFSDIDVLLSAFRELIDAGHTVVIIEHNLDVLRSADWLIDLGPEAGDKGGEVVFSGPPEKCTQCGRSHTGRSLLSYDPSTLHEPPAPYETAGRPKSGVTELMTVSGAREHNLKNCDVSVPRDRFTVITGVSGSGKSTIAFDILFAEGQRRYLESLNAYARQFVQPPSRPDVDRITGVPPTVAIEQRTSGGGRKSTVATITEIYHYIRLLFVKTGTQYCPTCNLPITMQRVDEVVSLVREQCQERSITVFSPLVTNRKGIYRDLAEWAHMHGHSHLRVDGTMVPTGNWPSLDRYREHSIDLPVAQLTEGVSDERRIRTAVRDGLDTGKGVLHIAPLSDLSGKSDIVLSTVRTCPQCRRGFDEPDPRLFSYNSRHGWCPRCFGTGILMKGFDEEQSGEEKWWNQWWDGEIVVCPACQGRRLCPEALSVKLRDRSIADYTGLSVGEAYEQFGGMTFSGREAALAVDIVPEITSRLRFLSAVGLGYLTLDRSAPTLSGGEAQRVRLAAQLGSNLRGVCYILDEPTIGLHCRDNDMLLDTLKSLRKKGNTVVVVEHDETTIRHADYLIDLGPGGGSMGGSVIASGSRSEVLRNGNSITAQHLRRKPHGKFAYRPVPAESDLIVHNATLHNLRSIDVTFPLGRLVTITGVSGSGKSTLVRSILHDNMVNLCSPRRKKAPPFGCASISGWEEVGRVLEVDQRPIGKTPRSCPATYIGFWDTVRKLYAKAPESLLRGYTASRFSFNTDEGRCPVCKGQGVLKIEMNFLPNVTVQCDTCSGRRFTGETLVVTFRERSIADILSMSVDEALPFFASHPSIHHPLDLLRQVGLGYLTLGQQSPTLSGGEAQRIKLVTELSRIKPASQRQTSRRNNRKNHTLFILDEPTVGLHMADIDNLMSALHRLVDGGNSVIIIEHNLEVIAQSDWVIDLGPEGGGDGGSVVAVGCPPELARQREKSHTGRYLHDYFNR
jgi:excinuclease ABC subunit A